MRSLIVTCLAALASLQSAQACPKPITTKPVTVTEDSVTKEADGYVNSVYFTNWYAMAPCTDGHDVDFFFFLRTGAFTGATTSLPTSQLPKSPMCSTLL